MTERREKRKLQAVADAFNRAFGTKATKEDVRDTLYAAGMFATVGSMSMTSIVSTFTKSYLRSAFVGGGVLGVVLAFLLAWAVPEIIHFIVICAENACEIGTEFVEGIKCVQRRGLLTGKRVLLN